MFSKSFRYSSTRKDEANSSRPQPVSQFETRPFGLPDLFAQPASAGSLGARSVRTGVGFELAHIPVVASDRVIQRDGDGEEAPYSVIPEQRTLAAVLLKNGDFLIENPALLERLCPYTRHAFLEENYRFLLAMSSDGWGCHRIWTTFLTEGAPYPINAGARLAELQRLFNEIGISRRREGDFIEYLKVNLLPDIKTNISGISLAQAYPVIDEMILEGPEGRQLYEDMVVSATGLQGRGRR